MAVPSYKLTRYNQTKNAIHPNYIARAIHTRNSSQLPKTYGNIKSPTTSHQVPLTTPRKRG